VAGVHEDGNQLRKGSSSDLVFASVPTAALFHVPWPYDLRVLTHVSTRDLPEIPFNNILSGGSPEQIRSSGNASDVYLTHARFECRSALMKFVRGFLQSVQENARSNIQARRYCILQHTKTPHSAHTMYLCVPYGSHSKQRLFTHTALTGWAL
jgi:hypothetical protein